MLTIKDCSVKFTVKPADRLEINFGRDDVWKYLFSFLESINAKKDNDDKPSEFPLINAGTGKPCFVAPQFVLDAATKAINDGFNQYVHPRGATLLINELSRIYSKKFNLLKINGMDNVQATRGSAGAFDVISRAFLNPNDEIVCLEPIWTYYIHQSVHFGGIVKSVRLDLIKNHDQYSSYQYQWKLDINKLKAVLNKNTKFLVLNTPHNPTGFVLSLSEMKEIEKLLLEQYPQILVITDEVYEYMVYNTDKNKQHFYMASLSKEMWQRTITISSASKTFSVTGWRIGWIIANKQLMKYIRPAASAHCGGGVHPFEIAIAESLKIADKEYKGKDNYYVWLRDIYEEKYKLMIDAFKSNGFHVIIPESRSTYFILVDVTDDINRLIKSGVLMEKQDDEDGDVKEEEKVYNVDWQFVAWIAEKIGVLFAPCSAFDYDEGDDERYLIRISFCIKNDDINNIKTRLSKLREILNHIE